MSWIASTWLMNEAGIAGAAMVSKFYNKLEKAE